jgi:hypothetical protein
LEPDDPGLRFLIWWDRLPLVGRLLLGLPAFAALFLGLGWAVLKSLRGVDGRAGAEVERCFEDLAFTAPADEHGVHVIFHTYHGALFYGVQTPHRFRARPDVARAVLWRLHRYNCTWGLLAPPVLLVPFLSFFNYAAQRRSIRLQEARLLARKHAD